MKNAGIHVSHGTGTMAINHEGRIGYPVSLRTPPIWPWSGPCIRHRMSAWTWWWPQGPKAASTHRNDTRPPDPWSATQHHPTRYQDRTPAPTDPRPYRRQRAAPGHLRPAHQYHRHRRRQRQRHSTPWWTAAPTRGDV